MTGDKKDIQGHPASFENANDISSLELSIFLKNLSALYKSKVVGNAALSKTLAKLSLFVAGQPDGFLDNTSRSKKTKDRAPQLTAAELAHLDEAGVEAFLDDITRTKNELIALAFARFSIPKAALSKSSISTVRERIRSAMMHERSIRIISQEAEREGAKRSS